MGLLKSFGFRQSVAPNFLAVLNFEELRSIPYIFEAPAALQPITTARPTAPKPQTAHVLPGSTFAVFRAAP